MTNVDVAGTLGLQQITVAAIAHAAGRGLFTAAEAGRLIDRIRAQATTSPLSIQDSQLVGVREQPRSHAPVDPDRTVR
jgi:hypothetical protein